jgi:ribosomal protein S3AE
LVRRRTTKVDGLFNLVTKDGFKLRISVSALTLSRIKTSQEKIIRDMMEKIIREKAATLTLDQFVQEMVLGKIASDIYNQAKLVAPLRHVGIRKSKLVAAPAKLPKFAVAPIVEAEAPEDEELEEDDEAPDEEEGATEEDDDTEEIEEVAQE